MIYGHYKCTKNIFDELESPHNSNVLGSIRSIWLPGTKVEDNNGRNNDLIWLERHKSDKSPHKNANIVIVNSLTWHL